MIAQKNLSSQQIVGGWLKSGVIVGTDNNTCTLAGTNRIPHTIEKLRGKGWEIKTILVPIERSGVKTRVANYKLISAPK